LINIDTGFNGRQNSEDTPGTGPGVNR